MKRNQTLALRLFSGGRDISYETNWQGQNSILFHNMDTCIPKQVSWFFLLEKCLLDLLHASWNHESNIRRCPRDKTTCVTIQQRWWEYHKAPGSNMPCLTYYLFQINLIFNLKKVPSQQPCWSSYCMGEQQPCILTIWPLSFSLIRSCLQAWAISTGTDKERKSNI